MKTIGVKELRLRLDQVLDRVLSGEDIIVRHRFKEPVRLSALRPPQSHPAGKLAGLRAFDAAPKKASPFDPQKSLKQLYSESIARKYTSR